MNAGGWMKDLSVSELLGDIPGDNSTVLTDERGSTQFRMHGMSPHNLAGNADHAADFVGRQITHLK